MNTDVGKRAAPVPLKRVSITGGFWEERQRVNREVTIPAIYQKLKENRANRFVVDGGDRR